MDCAYLLAEELTKRDCIFEAFVLLVGVVREERRAPYFRHFMQDVETFLKELVRLRLKSAVDEETYAECLHALLDLQFPASYENTIKRAIARAEKSTGSER
jgi:hypothetical protein